MALTRDGNAGESQIGRQFFDQGPRLAGKHVVGKSFLGGIRQPAKQSTVGTKDLRPVKVSRKRVELEKRPPAIGGNAEPLFVAELGRGDEIRSPQ